MKSRLLGRISARLTFLVPTTNVFGSLVSIDFNDLSPGIPVTTQYQSQGVTFSLIGSPLAGPYTYALE